MSIAARILLGLNRIFPRPIDYGGESADAYSQWEYDSGEMMHGLHFDDKVDFTGALVLDIGCGYGGKTAFYLNLSPAQVVGLDLLPENVSQAVEYTDRRSNNARVSFVAGDACDLPFADGTFDIVTATDTFEHFDDPGRVLDQIARVLKPGGHLLFYFTPHRSPLGSHLYDKIYLPWCHLLVRENTLFRAIEMKIEQEQNVLGAENSAETARALTSETREYYRNCLNGMTVRRFQSLMRARPELQQVYFYRKPLRSRLMKPLTHLPPFDELVTTLAVGLARKESA